MTDPLRIEAAVGDQLTRALQLLLRSEPRQRVPAEELAATLEAVAAGHLSTTGLRIARRGSTLVGAAWAHCFVGRSALVWPARLNGKEPYSTALQLHQALRCYLDDCGIHIAQTLLPNAADARAAVLHDAGFRHLAELRYLVRQPQATDDRHFASSLSFQPYDERQRGRIRSVVAASYTDTQDCPKLNGLRELDDVLDGYTEIGSYQPHRWFLVVAGGQDVGCVLLNDHPQHGHTELVYMALTPSHRGRGLGNQLTRFAVQQTARGRQSRLVLGVDADNQPAAAAYRQAGFVEFDRRAVFVLNLRDPAPPREHAGQPIDEPA